MRTAVDVSTYQGSINWAPVARTVDLAIIRTGDGTIEDDRARRNFVAARAAGMNPHSYHFCRPSLSGPGLVDWSLSISGPVPCLWLDLEDGANVDRAWIDAALNRCRQLAQPAGIYTQNSYWTPRFGRWWPDNVPLWVAGYPRGATTPPPPAQWSTWALSSVGVDTVAAQDWAIWQFSSSGRVAGIPGLVDCNIIADTLTLAAASTKPKEADMTPEQDATLTRIAQLLEAGLYPRGGIPAADAKAVLGDLRTAYTSELMVWAGRQEISRMALDARGGPAARNDTSTPVPTLTDIPTAALLAELARRTTA